MLNLDVYSTGQLQDFLALLNDAEQKGILNLQKIQHQIVTHITNNLQVTETITRDSFKETKHINIICFDCGNIAILSKVNISKCTRMKEKYKVVKICTDHKNCGKIEYFYESIDYVRKDQMQKSKEYLKHLKKV